MIIMSMRLTKSKCLQKTRFEDTGAGNKTKIVYSFDLF